MRVIIEGGPVDCCEPYDIFVYEGDELKARYKLKMACGGPGAERLVHEGKEYYNVDLDRIEKLCLELSCMELGEEPDEEEKAYKEELLGLLP